MAVQTSNKNREADYYRYVMAALGSARSFAPSLVPFIIHAPGNETAVPKNVLNHPGVHFIPHNLTFVAQLKASLGSSATSGPWYRLDIPYLIRNVLTNLSSDEYDLDYVLYTDTDVLFFSDFNDCTLPKPKVIYFGPEAFRHSIFNSGVLYLNVTAMWDLWPATYEYAQSKHWKFEAPYDQGLYVEFYTKYATQLDDIFNWKGYWGTPERGDPVIAHFHGLKPGDGCLECYLVYRNHYHENCKKSCNSQFLTLLDFVPDHGSMYERMLGMFQNFTHHHHNHHH